MGKLITIIKLGLITLSVGATAFLAYHLINLNETSPPVTSQIAKSCNYKLHHRHAPRATGDFNIEEKNQPALDTQAF